MPKRTLVRERIATSKTGENFPLPHTPLLASGTGFDILTIVTILDFVRINSLRDRSVATSTALDGGEIPIIAALIPGWFQVGSKLVDSHPRFYVHKDFEMLRLIGRSLRLFGGLGLGVFAMGLLLGAASLTLTGCGGGSSEGDKIEKVDFAQKGADSMKSYMSQKAEKKAEKKK
jgi:hypothetical protein